MKEVPIQIGPASYRPHIKLPREQFDSLQIGNGCSALLRLSPPSSSSALAIPDHSQRWICAPVWHYDPSSEDQEDLSRTSRAGTPRRNITPAPSNSKFEGITVSGNFLPFITISESNPLRCEILPCNTKDSIHAYEVKLEVIQMREAAAGSQGESSAILDEDTLNLLSILAKEILLEIGAVLPSQIFSVIHQGLEIALQVRATTPFHLQSFEDAQKHVLLVSRGTDVTVNQKRSSDSKRRSSLPSSSQLRTEKDVTPQSNPKLTLGGMEEEMKQMRELVFLPLMRPDLFEQHNLQPPRGVLLHGPPGTGKTSLSLAVASSFLTPSQIFTISGPELSSSYHGRTESRLRKVFSQARKQEKAVVIIDEIDTIAASRDGGDGDSVGSRVVATLLTEIDGVGQEYKKKGKRKADGDQDKSGGSSKSPGRVVVIAATNRPNVIDPALRRPGRLDREIEIGVPNPAARLDILSKLLANTPHSLTSDDLNHVANTTHGFVGADLSALVREAGMRVIRRQMALEQEQNAEHLQGALAQAVGSISLSDHRSQSNPTLLSTDDLLSVLPLMRPSSLRSMLPPPPLSWSSIGLGSPDSPYSRIKRSIQQTIEWPLRYPDRMRRLGVSGNRGVLLYGPPGCSKTMIARACAQSEGINWIGVKGPELFSKYLGDSEKAIRELFRKARAAAPTIVFFDEIDALTTTRSSGGDDGGANAVSDRVIATLLTELDGTDALEKVVVIAATNRPQIIDPALLRPGRLDTLLYVGPPDVSARRSIFELRATNMSAAADLDLDKLAQMTEGCSGAEIVSICQDAGIRAMSDNIDAEAVEQRHFEDAARTIRKRITPDVIRSYEAWRDQRSS
ncbi:unnamed protein product [Sympodiomycopsis kandeliae]